MSASPLSKQNDARPLVNGPQVTSAVVRCPPVTVPAAEQNLGGHRSSHEGAASDVDRPVPRTNGPQDCGARGWRWGSGLHGNHSLPFGAQVPSASCWFPGGSGGWTQNPSQRLFPRPDLLLFLNPGLETTLRGDREIPCPVPSCSWPLGRGCPQGTV